MRTELGKATYQRVGRALRRREPLPPHLQPWAVAYLHYQLGTAALPVAFGTCAGLTSTLLSRSVSTSLAATHVVFTALLVVFDLVVLAVLAASWWMHRNARLLGLPLDPTHTNPPHPDPPDTDPPHPNTTACP